MLIHCCCCGHCMRRRPVLTIATASVFLHRFYMMHSLKQYGSREVAMACLFLAGKVEESLRKVEAVVNYLLRLEDRRKGKEPDVHPTSEVGRRATTRGE